jgi:hypothetical protein
LIVDLEFHDQTEKCFVEKDKYLKLNPFRKNNNKEIGSRLDINYDI